MFDRIITPAVTCHAAIFTAITPRSHLTLKRRSLPTISPSFRHPLLLDLSSTSQSLRTTGSFNRLIFTDRSKQSDMVDGLPWTCRFRWVKPSENRPCNKFGLFPGRQTAVKATHLGPVSAAQRSSRRQMNLHWDKNESFWFSNVGWLLLVLSSTKVCWWF